MIIESVRHLDYYISHSVEPNGFDAKAAIW